MKRILTWLERNSQKRKDPNIDKALKQPADPQQHKNQVQRQQRDRHSAAYLMDIGTWAQETEAEKRARLTVELLDDAGLIPGEPKSILPDVELLEIDKRSDSPTP